MIRSRKLGKKFGNRWIFRGLDLSITAGERVALNGANGAGKTTLLKVFSTLLSPDEGEAWIGEHSVLSDSRAARARLGFVPASDQGFFPRFTGLENLIFFGSLRGLSENETREALEDMRTFKPLIAALETPFHACSSGMKQTLALARACLGSPSVLLLDEPTRSLDRETTAELHLFLAEWSRKPERALLIATHSDAESKDLCNREIPL